MSEKRLFHSVAEQISTLIDEGVFPPGVRLPGERELAERFGVSRVTIREAEIALQAIGRIEIKTGSGVYVCERQPDEPGTLPDVSAFELTEARSLFEAEAAALAAENITPEALDKMEMLLDKMNVPGHLDEAVDADHEFHLTIAEASGNRAVVHTIVSLWRMREELPEVKTAYDSVCGKDTQSRVQEHRDIFDALKAGDSNAARRAMQQHFHRLISSMLDVAEKQELEEVQQRANETRERFLAASRVRLRQ